MAFIAGEPNLICLTIYVLHISGRIFVLCVSIMYNGYVYETFGISKHFPVKLQLLLIRAEMFDNSLTAKCFIHDVGCWCSIFPVIFLIFVNRINYLELQVCS